MNISVRRCASLALVLSSFGPLAAVASPGAKPAAHEEPVPDLDSSLEGNALRGALQSSTYHLTAPVKAAYLRYAKARALREIAAAGKSVPADFISWIDADPVTQATVYGARQKASDVLLMLRSLELDLGQDVVRRRYPQLALAMAVVEAKNGPAADLAPRPPLTLLIPGDPRKPVDTHAKDRPLDVNDHIINFLEDHAPIAGDPFGSHEKPPELKYDEKGGAIVDTEKRGKGTKQEKVTRALLAADVLESRPLQEEFNAYMAAHGQSVRIDCGDHVISPEQHDAVKGPSAAGILAAYKLFRTAYEAKGRLPASRDTLATPAERLAFLIRNDSFRFSESETPKRQWPQYPLTAPWPTLTLLAAAAEPLREREEIWRRFVDTGEMIRYGEYIGGIAQQFDFQSARRLSPYAFTYGSFQMMVKDGGVCGTMANMGVRTHTALGVPACTAGQPGHCALISFTYDDKTKTYSCHGEQYATGGDGDTHPHVNWVFGDTDEKRDMVWYQSVAWAVNAGLQSYLDSMIALDVYRTLSEPERKRYGLVTLASGLSLNPYNFALVEAGQKGAVTDAQEVAFMEYFDGLFSAESGKPGCPQNGLYNTTARKLADERLAELKPADKEEAARTLAYLKQENSTNGRALTAAAMAIDGLPAVMKRTKDSYGAYLASNRTESECETMAGTIASVAAQIADKNQRAAWASELAGLVSNREYYFSSKNKVVFDSSVKALIKLAAYHEQPKDVTYGVLRKELNEEVKASFNGPRGLPECRKLAARIISLGGAIKNAEINSSWESELQQIVSGKETFVPKGAKPNAKPVADPCVAAITGLAKMGG